MRFAVYFLFLALVFCFVPNSLDCQAASRNARHAAQQKQAQPQTPPAKAGDEIKTEYFNLKLPAGWIMPYPVNHKPNGTSAVFADEKSHVTVTVNVIKANLSVKQFMDMILPDMKKSGLKPGMPVMEKGLYRVTIQGKPQGEAWFGSNGKLCTATVILSQSAKLSAANELLAVFKTGLPALFPQRLK